MSNRKFVLTSLIAVLLLGVVNIFPLAASQSTDVPYCPYVDEGEEEVKNFEDFIMEKQVEFQEATTTLLEKKSPNSILMEFGVKKFNQVQAEIQEKYELTRKFITSPPVEMEAAGETEAAKEMRTLTATETFSRGSECEGIMATRLYEMYQPFEMSLRSTSEVKKTTILMDKYKHINGRLRGLNLKLAETLGYYLTLQNKFQGYIPACE
jgi:hypothetical protein